MTQLGTYTRFALVLLITTVAFGVMSIFSFLYPESFNKTLPFYQLRPLHVSSALFWIITGATSAILHFKKEVFTNHFNKRRQKVFVVMWVITIVAIFICYGFKLFGGREYWEFPPVLGIPLLASWIVFMTVYFTKWFQRSKPMPLYAWMWTTGVVFFLVTFLEQNLWQLSWFRTSFLKEVTVQWKANGAMVGAWNQMIYGTALYLMVKIGEDESIAQSKKAFFFYFLGLANLMFNWGHHFYNLPAASWIRHTSYIISMTEWLIFISIIRGFKWKLAERNRLKHLIPYRFLLASEFWVFLNLFLALLMSIPAINRYTHGTHITVAHAMGTTIGINTMILLGSISFILNIDGQSARLKRALTISNVICQVSLVIFWSSLIVAGIIKGYRSVTLNIADFREMMRPVIMVIKISATSGIIVATALVVIASCLLSVRYRVAQIPVKKKKYSEEEIF